MTKKSYLRLTVRERQIMDALYRRGRATAAELLGDLPDPPTNAAVRAKLRVLEEKGYVTHEQDGPRFLYRPRLPQGEAGYTALRHLLETFFAGSIEQTMTAMLRLREDELSRDKLDRLAELIEEHRKE